jgi:hypothetical protein
VTLVRAHSRLAAIVTRHGTFMNHVDFVLQTERSKSNHSRYMSAFEAPVARNAGAPEVLNRDEKL